jgi:hypothetical protein
MWNSEKGCDISRSNFLQIIGLHPMFIIHKLRILFDPICRVFIVQNTVGVYYESTGSFDSRSQAAAKLTPENSSPIRSLGQKMAEFSENIEHMNLKPVGP